ncbi:hypothetical protein [Cyanobacterium aponinum]|uniref:N-acetyltransferase domain-containing protein n=1 Tax=Cyanobacterium aponinum 0216 TaxID=2676140 RepID=A0A844GRY3_9CHRO|nr:hypothetical protein [Cyanobacterium aponinum]MTF37508.1 hypothetical protein [Cyanobacterium aponinum 0216]
MCLSLSIKNSYNDQKDLYITSFVTDINAYLDEDQLSEEDLKNLTKDPTKIGYILAYRLDLSYSLDDLLYYSNCEGSDLLLFTEFFSNHEDYLLTDYLFYIDRVIIKPHYQGHNYGLKALAIFLELFAKQQAVGCHPHPLESSRSKFLRKKYSKQKVRSIMTRYWSKLGFDCYDKKHNILWTDEWCMPSYLEL